MRQMMLVLNSFLSALFAMDITGKTAMNRLSSLARFYLCLTSRMDKYLMKKSPSWITTFSLLGMLQIVDTYQLAPYPVCFYEGDGMGEGIIKDIRPILLTGLRKGWTTAGQGTYYRMKTLSYMQELLLSKSSLALVLSQRKPVRSKTKVYKYAADVEHAIDNCEPFAFALFSTIFTGEKVIGIVICFAKQHYFRILNVDNEEAFQDPHGFTYFSTSMFPKKESIAVDVENLSSLALTYVTSGVALPSSQAGKFAFILGNGEKKVSGNYIRFYPTTINRRCNSETSTTTI